MSEEEKKDLKAEEKTSGEDGQSQEKNKTEFNNEEEITLSKTEYDQLKADKEKAERDRDNYRKGFLNSKRNGRSLPGVKKVDEDNPSKPNEDEDDFEKDLKSKFVSKADFQKSIENAAIKEASKDSEFDEHWDDIMSYYIPRQGKDSVENILVDLERAKKAWRIDNPKEVKEEKKDDADKKAKAALSEEDEIRKGKEKKPAEKKKSILLNKEEKMSNWYGSDK